MTHGSTVRLASLCLALKLENFIQTCINAKEAEGNHCICLRGLLFRGMFCIVLLFSENIIVVIIFMIAIILIVDDSYLVFFVWNLNRFPLGINKASCLYPSGHLSILSTLLKLQDIEKYNKKYFNIQNKKSLLNIYMLKVYKYFF